MSDYFLLSLFLHLWGSGRNELFPEVLDLLFVLINFLYNLINFLRCHGSCYFLAFWNFVIGYNYSLLEPIHAIFLIFGLNLDLIEHQIQLLFIVLCVLQIFYVCTSCATLNFSLYSALVGIRPITNYISLDISRVSGLQSHPCATRWV
jgi:hypothetical protein